MCRSAFAARRFFFSLIGQLTRQVCDSATVSTRGLFFLAPFFLTPQCFFRSALTQAESVTTRTQPMCFLPNPHTACFSLVPTPSLSFGSAQDLRCCFFFWSDFFFRWCFALTHPFPPHATRPILPIFQPCLRIRTNASSRSSARRITTSGALVGCYARSAGQTSQKTEKKNCLFLNVAPPHLPYVRNSIQKIPPESLSHILSHT